MPLVSNPAICEATLGQPSFQSTSLCSLHTHFAAINACMSRHCAGIGASVDASRDSHQLGASQERAR